MMPSFQKYTYLLLPILLVVLHAAWVIQQSTLTEAGKAKKQTLAQFSLDQRAHTVALSDTHSFSRLFGVEPEAATDNSADTASETDARFLTLVDVMPKLIAVDEVSAVLTARLWLTLTTDIQAALNAAEENGYTLTLPPLQSLKVGDQLLHYQVKSIALNVITLNFMPTLTHEWPEDQAHLITLHLFKPLTADTDNAALSAE